ncbi:MAG: response regulator [Pseudomonadales bacterium]|nr:response regulator [Pseudomonadales bacterium]
MRLIEFLLQLLRIRDSRDCLASTFSDELHFQSRRVVRFAAFASVMWLLYVPVDRELHPDLPIILYLRYLLLAAGIVIFVLDQTPFFKQRSQIVLSIWGLYLITAAGAISGLTGIDPTYIPGLIVCMCLLPMAPIHKRYSFLIMISAIVITLTCAAAQSVDFSATRVRYSLNDLASATIAISLFIYILDRIRFHSWENARIIERESLKKLDRAQEESRAKSRFLATMSHEIRTPMNGVIGMTELLQTTSMEPQQRQYVEVISNSGKALLNIINDILDYSKIEAGKLELEEVDYDLDKLCLDVASVFSLTSEKKQLEFLVSIKPGTPTFVKGDPARLRQILLNLIGNAFKFTQSGGIYLRIFSESDESGQHQLKFEIQDTGIGMTPEQMNSLFEAFNQADSSTTRKFGGTGLGLSISKSLAELMGGEIGVESESGIGSKFWFTVKCRPADENFIQQHAISVAELKGKKVLFVDDSVEFTQVVLEQAVSWGMAAETAYHGEAALEKLRDAEAKGTPFDIVSLDINMPGMNGMQVAHTIQQDPAIGVVSMILLTAMRITPPKEDLEAAGVSRAMQKPASARAIKECFLGLVGCDLPPAVIQEQSQNSALNGIHILVAEDNAVNQIVIKNMLKKLGVECTIAENGFGAVRLFEQANPAFDLVLMDCEMPEMDGFEATQKIRQYEAENEQPATPVLALTAHAMKEHLLLCHEAGMDDCLSKPVELDNLKDKLMEALSLTN